MRIEKRMWMSEKATGLILLLMCCISFATLGKSAVARIHGSSAQVPATTAELPTEFMSPTVPVTTTAVEPAVREAVWVDDSANGFTIYKGDFAYFEEGVLHSTKGPAIVRDNGDCEYWLWGMKYANYESWATAAKMVDDIEGNVVTLKTYFDGYQHRLQEYSPNEFDSSSRINGLLNDVFGPALQSNDGSYVHFTAGAITCDSAPAVMSTFGSKAWVVDGVLTRDDGPAVEFENGVKWYLHDGAFHRMAGPAIEVDDAHMISAHDEYWIDGVQQSFSAIDTLDSIQVDSIKSDFAHDTSNSLYGPSAYMIPN